jgi:hypothetical protein
MRVSHGFMLFGLARSVIGLLRALMFGHGRA